MSGGGSKPGERRGGRQKGGPNKATVEKALVAQRELEQAQKTGRKLCKDVLEDFAMAFAAVAVGFQPREGNTGNLDKFEKWGRLACETLDRAAKFQSPTFKAIAVSPMSLTTDPQRGPKDENVIDITSATTVSRVYMRRLQAVK